MAADSVNTASLTSVVLIPSVALAAGLSFSASSRWPNVERRMADDQQVQQREHRR